MEKNKFLATLKSYKRMQYINGYFEIDEDGVWFIKDNSGDAQKLFICSPIVVLAKHAMKTLMVGDVLYSG